MRISVLLAAILLPSSLFSEETQGLDNYFVAPSGADFPALANQWSQWVYAIPDWRRPDRDLSGIFCASGQKGEVWFLADADSPETISRKCTIPSGKSIFFPVIRNIIHPHPSVDIDCDEAKDGAVFDDSPSYVVQVSLNGIEFSSPEEYRFSSRECFDLLARVDRDKNPPSIAPSATGGYWFMIAPLPAGSYELLISAQFEGADRSRPLTVTDVRYSLEVEN